MANEYRELVIARGTTPRVIVTVPEAIDMECITDVSITVAQKDYGIAVIKGIDDVRKDNANRQFSFFLNEADTLGLIAFKTASIQIKLMDSENVVLACYAVTADVIPVLEEFNLLLEKP